jgi:hypothetical protein
MESRLVTTLADWKGLGLASKTVEMLEERMAKPSELWREQRKVYR